MDSKPRQYSPIERLGVNAVERQVLGFHWIFREHSISDFGVDAEIEVCDDGIPTGRLLKVQIKSGDSWFSERTPDGVVFRGSIAHFEYWLRHCLPVILMVYEPSIDQVWWEHISLRSAKKTPKGYKMLIPDTQILTPLSAKKLRSLAPEQTEEIPLSASVISSIYTRFKVLENAIGSAKFSIDVATPRINSHLIGILALASTRIQIRVILDEEDKASISSFLVMKNSGLLINLHTCKGLHIKQIIVDKQIAIYGSNLDPITLNLETFYSATNEQLLRSIDNEFEQVWEMSAGAA